jgi:DNA (cytosine-5)-methyltransferase 1
LECLQRQGNSSNNPSRKGRRRYKHKTSCSCVFYSEIDKFAVQTYNKNFGENHKPADIRTIKTDSIPDFDILCGGFPCQAFSIAGRRRGFKDTRGTLFFEIARIIKAKRPKLVFLENVKGLLNHENGQTFSIIIQTISELGYNVQWMVFNSKFFGVPQNRERVFIIGSLRGEPRPEILPLRYSNEEDYSQPEYAQYDPNFTGNRSQDYRIYNPNKIIGTLPTTNTDMKILDLYNKKEHSDRSPTLTEPHHNTLRVREGMKIRRLTPLECERLQGFPEGWTEGVSDTQRYKQMGNAVTVNVIEAIARKLI